MVSLKTYSKSQDSGQIIFHIHEINSKIKGLGRGWRVEREEERRERGEWREIV